MRDLRLDGPAAGALRLAPAGTVIMTPPGEVALAAKATGRLTMDKRRVARKHAPGRRGYDVERTPCAPSPPGFDE